VPGRANHLSRVGQPLAGWVVANTDSGAWEFLQLLIPKERLPAEIYGKELRFKSIFLDSDGCLHVVLE